MKTTVYLIRHSEKMEHPRNGWAFFDRIQPLSVNGEKKAQGLLELRALRDADAVYCSPFSRTLSTLRYLMEADNLQAVLDDRLKELEFGGKPDHGETSRSDFRPGPPPDIDFRVRQWEDRDLAAPNGESLNQCCQRMSSAIQEYVQQNPGKRILVGSHGVAICSYLSSMVDYIDDDYTRSLPQPAVFCLTFDGAQIVNIERLALPEAAQ